MSSIYKTSRAQIQTTTGNRPIRIVEYENPEEILAKALKDYFLEIGFSASYPNFGDIRISSVHPFALLLFADVMGQKLNTNVFPSITISDSTDNEAFHELALGEERIVMDGADIAKIKGYVDTGQVFISDEAMTRLENAIANGGKVVGVKKQYRATHSFDFNIWTENKDVTSFIYDLVKQCLIMKITDLHNLGIDFQGDMSGRRSGDINLEFGKLLYGANVRASGAIVQGCMIVDLPLGEIMKIDTKTYPEYHNPGE